MFDLSSCPLVSITMRFHSIYFHQKHQRGSETCSQNFLKEGRAKLCLFFIKGVDNPLNSETWSEISLTLHQISNLKYLELHRFYSWDYFLFFYNWRKGKGKKDCFPEKWQIKLFHVILKKKTKNYTHTHTHTHTHLKTYTFSLCSRLTMFTKTLPGK